MFGVVIAYWRFCWRFGWCGVTYSGRGRWRAPITFSHLAGGRVETLADFQFDFAAGDFDPNLAAITFSGNGGVIFKATIHPCAALAVAAGDDAADGEALLRAGRVRFHDGAHGTDFARELE